MMMFLILLVTILGSTAPIRGETSFQFNWNDNDSEVLFGDKSHMPDGTGLTKIMNRNDITEYGKCGTFSRFAGRKLGPGESVRLKFISKITSEQFCDGDLSDYILYLGRDDQDFHGALVEDEAFFESFTSCFPELNLLQHSNLFGLMGAKDNIGGFMVNCDYPGIFIADDFGLDRKEMDVNHRHAFVLECIFPELWRPILMNSTFDDPVEIEISLELVGISTMFSAWYYKFIFRGLLPGTYLMVALFGVFLVIEHFKYSQNKKGERAIKVLPVTVIVVNCIVCVLCALMLIVEGWYSEGNVTSSFRDVFPALLVGPSMGTLFLVALQWSDCVSMTMHRRKIESIFVQKRYTVIALGTFVTATSTSLIVLSIEEVISIYQIRTTLISWYLTMEAAFSAYFMVQSRKFSKMLILTIMGDSDVESTRQSRSPVEGKFSKYLTLMTKKIHRLSVVLIAFLIGTTLLGFDVMMISDFLWISFWTSYIFIRAIMSLAIMDVCRKSVG